MLGRLRAPLTRSARVFQRGTNAPTNFVGRHFSAVPPTDSNDNSTLSSFDQVATSDSVTDAANLLEVVKPDDVNMISATMMTMVDNVHLFLGVPYWEAIAITTVGIRLAMFPVALKTVQSGARMASMRPEMQKIQDAMKSDPNGDQAEVKMRYQQEMSATFKKHKINPLHSILWPLSQFPIFIGFFIALREMGVHYPGFATGGALWFQDLGAMDPTYILPVLNSLSFLIMIEIGSDGMATSQQGTFKTIMRAMAVIMVPVTSQMPAGLFCYWGVNNLLSIIQTYVLKQEGVRQFFNIPKPPPADQQPAMKMMDFTGKVREALAKERSQGLDAKAEILDAEIIPAKTTSTVTTETKPTPTYFTAPPKKGKGEKK